jgi:membrane-associated phospholipid phosphatase
MRKAIAPILAAGLLMALAFVLDPWVWRHLSYPAVYEHDWGRLLRVTGSLVFWAPLTLAMGLQLRAGHPPRSAGVWRVLAAPVLAGGVAELLKLLVRRERPGLHEGTYVFRGFAERPFDTHDIGFPSSHAVVAFAGAAVLSRVYPRAGAVAYALALGCAATRVLAQAHFASDVVAGGIAGWAVGAWVGRSWRPA